MLSGYSNWRTAVAGDTISSPHERTSAAFGLLCSIAKPGIPAACPIYLTLDWPECSEGVATDSMAGAWRFLLPQPAWMPHWHPSRLRPWGKPQRWLPRTRWQQQYPLERGGGATSAQTLRRLHPLDFHPRRRLAGPAPASSPSPDPPSPRRAGSRQHCYPLSLPNGCVVECS